MSGHARDGLRLEQIGRVFKPAFETIAGLNNLQAKIKFGSFEIDFETTDGRVGQCRRQHGACPKNKSDLDNRIVTSVPWRLEFSADLLERELGVTLSLG